MLLKVRSRTNNLKLYDQEDFSHLPRAGGMGAMGQRVECQSINYSASGDIIESTKNSDVHVRLLDLSSLDSVRKFAKEINETEDRLDILVNNAASIGNKPIKTADELDIYLQINHYGPFLLTNLLLDLLKRSAPSRVVMVSSGAHKWVTVDFNNLDKEYRGFDNYCAAKLFNLMIANSLAEKLKGTGITVNSVHPGMVATDICRALPPLARYLINNTILFFQKAPADGAQGVIDAAVSENLEGVTGKYFVDCKEAEISEVAKNPKLAEAVWKHSENAVKHHFKMPECQ